MLDGRDGMLDWSERDGIVGRGAGRGVGYAVNRGRMDVVSMEGLMGIDVGWKDGWMEGWKDGRMRGWAGNPYLLIPFEEMEKKTGRLIGDLGSG